MMTSNGDEYQAMQQPIEVKKEKVEIDYNEPCTSTCTDIQDDKGEFIKRLSYDEIISSIEIVEELRKTLTDANQRKTEEECTDTERERKQEKESESELNHHFVSIDNLKSEIQGCTTTSKTDSENIYQSALSNDFKEGFCDREAKIFCKLISTMSSNSENTTQSPSFSYKEVKDISRIKEESIEINLNKSEFPEVSTCVDKYSIHAEVPVFLDYFLCGSSRDSITNRNIEVTTICEYASEDEINIGQCPIRIEMGKRLNRAKGEPKMELSREKQTMQTNSRTRRKSTNMFCGSIIETKTCSKENTKVCDFCQNKFQHLFDLKRHVKIHTGQRSYKCQVCKHKFTTRGSLKRHMITHSGEKPYKCEICNHKCTDKLNLKKHLRRHSRESPFKCEICSNKFAEKRNLKRHMITHSGERPYKCEICNHECTDKKNLKKHLRRHSGESPYECEICSHKFTEKGSLKMHIRTHSGERPYKCEKCNYKFTQKGALERHMRTHSGERPFKCEICENRFNRACNLKIHMRTHSGERPFTCEICKHKFTQKVNLKRHLKTHTID